ncbi:hypothetical protein EJ04DRAFT_63571 [Polyplosphaeria fusca]|uniref:Uncharacterized protein n=1 Tax=Polyplosphaeria fusca TaxID=682080 RepID=A0A9P4QNB4_9PLEO|nr:hypothetical protein EJ04DRAFT_63571 [Polyplosphaeria fusca]
MKGRTRNPGSTEIVCLQDVRLVVPSHAERARCNRPPKISQMSPARRETGREQRTAGCGHDKGLPPAMDAVEDTNAASAVSAAARSGPMALLPCVGQGGCVSTVLLAKVRSQTCHGRPEQRSDAATQQRFWDTVARSTGWDRRAKRGEAGQAGQAGPGAGGEGRGVGGVGVRAHKPAGLRENVGGRGRDLRGMGPLDLGCVCCFLLAVRPILTVLVAGIFRGRADDERARAAASRRVSVGVVAVAAGRVRRTWALDWAERAGQAGEVRQRPSEGEAGGGGDGVESCEGPVATRAGFGVSYRREWPAGLALRPWRRDGREHAKCWVWLNRRRAPQNLKSSPTSLPLPCPVPVARCPFPSRRRSIVQQLPLPVCDSALDSLSSCRLTPPVRTSDAAATPILSATSRH